MIHSNEELQKLIDSHGAAGKIVNGKWWYQPIKFREGLMTHSHKWTDEVFYSKKTFGINKWIHYVEPFLPFDLKDKILLDMGSNSGLFLIQALREGAAFVYGIESDHKGLGRIDQHRIVVEIFSEIDGVDYANKIHLIRKQVHEIDWDKEFHHHIDITIAANVLYWLTYSEEGGSVSAAEGVLKDVLSNLSEKSSYLLVIGDESVQRNRKNKNINYFCSGISTTLPFLEDSYKVIESWIDPVLEVEDRETSVILARSR